MKSTIRTATFAFTIAALATLTAFSGTVQAKSSVPKPKPPVVATDSHPVPNCPINDPNGCGIYSN